MYGHPVELPVDIHSGRETKNLRVEILVSFGELKLGISNLSLEKETPVATSNWIHWIQTS